MRPRSQHGSNKTLIVGLLMTLFVLFGAGVAVFIYDAYQPKVMASGHRWLLSAAEGNVKLFTVVYAEEMTKGVGEQIREAKCHVLIELPAESDMSVTGGGTGSDGSIYRNVRFRRQDKPEDAQQYKQLGVAFHVEKGLLTVVDQAITYRTNEKQGVEAVVAEESSHGPLTTAQGNVFVVRLDSDFNIVDVIPLKEEIHQRLDDATVDRLIDEQE